MSAMFGRTILLSGQYDATTILIWEEQELSWTKVYLTTWKEWENKEGKE